MALSNATAFILPLLLRIMAIMTTRFTAQRLRRRLEKGQDFERILTMVGASLTLAGISWALLLWPLMAVITTEPFAHVILGITIVGVSLISAMLGPQKYLLFGFVGGFLVTGALGVMLADTQLHVPIILATLAMTGGMVAFSLGSARQMVQVAETLVENRYLEEELLDALAHARFLSRRDPLTGLLNRRAFFDDGCGDRQEKQDSGFVLAIDLDHFKSINDTFGHGVGDQVLAATGDAMRDVMRSIEPAKAVGVRMGGEEFALLLPSATESEAQSIAEDLRTRIAALADEIGPDGLQTSASIGMAEVSSESGVAAALHQADAALYSAKQAGRNRVMSEVPAASRPRRGWTRTTDTVNSYG